MQRFLQNHLSLAFGIVFGVRASLVEENRLGDLMMMGFFMTWWIIGRTTDLILGHFNDLRTRMKELQEFVRELKHSGDEPPIGL